MPSPDYAALPLSHASPPREMVSVTPSNSANISPVLTALFTSGGGRIRITLLENADGTYQEFDLDPRQTFRGLIKRVWSTGTTATGLIGFR